MDFDRTIFVSVYAKILLSLISVNREFFYLYDCVDECKFFNTLDNREFENVKGDKTVVVITCLINSKRASIGSKCSSIFIGYTSLLDSIAE